LMDKKYHLNIVKKLVLYVLYCVLTCLAGVTKQKAVAAKCPS